MLRELDTVLMNSRVAAASPGGVLPGLADTCNELDRAVDELAARMNALGRCTESSGASDSDQLRRVTTQVSHGAADLSTVYHRLARDAHHPRASPLHDQLALIARDNLVLLAHLLASMIDQSAALALRTAATGGAEQVLLNAQFDQPSDEEALARWTPLDLAYDRHATTRALHDPERCRGMADAVPETGVPVIRRSAAEAVEYAEPPRKAASKCPGLGLTGVLIGLLIGDALFDGD